MNILNRLLIILGLKREPTIERITSPMATIVRKLEVYAADQAARAEADEKAAADLLAKSRKETACACDARSLAGRYSSLTTPVAAE